MTATTLLPEERKPAKRQPFRGDHVSLHVTVPVKLREDAEREARALGITASTIITRLLIDRYGEPPAIGLVPPPLPESPPLD